MFQRRLLIGMFILSVCITSGTIFYLFDVTPLRAVDSYSSSALRHEEMSPRNKTLSPRNKTLSPPMSTRVAAMKKIEKSATTISTITKLPPLAPVTCRKNSSFRIPNIIHHIWFGVRNLQFFHYISMRSAALIHQPDEVRVYYDQKEPGGIYWNRYKAEIPCLKLIKMKAPESVFGHKVNVVEHKADVARLQIMIENGGIYLDIDTVVTRPFDELMNHSCVLGASVAKAYGNGVILAEAQAPFVIEWFERYSTFDDKLWGEYSVLMPFKLHAENPDLPLHVEHNTFYKPIFTDGMEWFEKRNYDFSSNFCVHLYARFYSKSTLKMTERDILAFNATYGALARVGLYGKPDLLI